jgi:hypothetical protein
MAVSFARTSRYTCAVSEPAGRRALAIAEYERIARELYSEAVGGEAARLERLPLALARDVRAWQERVRQEGWQLDVEEWTLGLLTLIRLAERADAAEALGSVRELK